MSVSPETSVSGSAGPKIAIIGGGAWGTALAAAACRAQTNDQHQALLYAREPDTVHAIRNRRENTIYLPGISLPKGVLATQDLSDIQQCTLALLVVPAQALHEFLPRFLPFWRSDKPLILCAKGIDRQSGLLPVDLVRSVRADQSLAVLSGPSFAHDVAQGKPTAVTLAAPNLAVAEALAAELASDLFRPYASDDLIGVEIGGALKNIYAIGCGLSDGRGFGASAKAALMARGFAEMVRFGTHCGARAETFMGLSGMGDMVLTCTTNQSRNYALGYKLGRGDVDLADIGSAKLPLSEGAFTARVAAALAHKAGLDLPIMTTIAHILDGQQPIEDAISHLLARPVGSEF